MTPRFIILNTCWTAAFIAATATGFTRFVFEGDGSYVSYVIAVILVASLAGSAAGRRKHILKAAWLCEALGFFGTVVGIAMGLYQGGGNLSTTEGLIAAGNALYAGMGTAFFSTIVGFICMLWLWSVAQVVGEEPGKC